MIFRILPHRRAFVLPNQANVTNWLIDQNVTQQVQSDVTGENENGPWSKHNVTIGEIQMNKQRTRNG